MAYPAALGCGCFLGSGASPLWAAEWSITPIYSSSVDYDSNRTLSSEAQGSESEVVAADLRFKRALEDTDFFIEPRYSLRRYSDPRLGNGDDRSLNAGFDWLRETSTLSLTASTLNQSTLVSELFESGLTLADTHQRLTQAGANWTWSQTEKRQLLAQFSYLDVSYYGAGRALLPGYKYPSGTLGERFTFSEQGSVSASFFGSEISSQTQGNSSREDGFQAEVVYVFSERTRFDGSIGQSSRVLSGVSSHGTDASATLTHALENGSLSLGYTRSLVPEGFGFLVQREQFSASAQRALTPTLDSNLSLLRIQNNEIAVLLNVDRRSYDSIAAGLTWHPSETWSLAGQISGLRTEAPGLSGTTVNEWRSAVTLSWFPHPVTRSW